MYKRPTILLLAAAFFLTGCGIRASLRARAMAGCTFAFESIEIQPLDFVPAVTFNATGNTYSVNDLSLDDLRPLAHELKNGDFTIGIKRLRFTANVRITNPGTAGAVLDRVRLDALLDDTHAALLEHRGNTGIPAGSSAVVPFDVTITGPAALYGLRSARDVILKGKIWLRPVRHDVPGKAVPVPVSITRPVPREQFSAAVDKQKKKIVGNLLRKLAGTIKEQDPDANVMDVFRDLFK